MPFFSTRKRKKTTYHTLAGTQSFCRPFTVVWNLPLLSIVNVLLHSYSAYAWCVIINCFYLAYRDRSRFGLSHAIRDTGDRRENPNIGIRHYRYCDYKILLQNNAFLMANACNAWPQPGLTSDHWSLRNDVTIGNRKAATVLFVPMFHYQFRWFLIYSFTYGWGTPQIVWQIIAKIDSRSWRLTGQSLILKRIVWIPHAAWE